VPSTDKACQLIQETAQKGAQLAAFPETFLPGYPFHAFAPKNGELWYEVAGLYIDQAVEIPGDTEEVEE
jgi:nitrilase